MLLGIGRVIRTHIHRRVIFSEASRKANTWVTDLHLMAMGRWMLAVEAASLGSSVVAEFTVYTRDMAVILGETSGGFSVRLTSELSVSGLNCGHWRSEVLYKNLLLAFLLSQVRATIHTLLR